MARVWKYEVELGQRFTLRVPEHAEILHFDEQRGSLALWALVHPELELENRKFEIAGTGHPIEDPAADEALIHRGTVLTTSGYVWHLFERLEGVPF